MRTPGISGGVFVYCLLWVSFVLFHLLNRAIYAVEVYRCIGEMRVVLFDEPDGSRMTHLPVSWGDVYDSISLTKWVTHDLLTGVLGRQPREYIILYLLNRMGHA